MSNVGNIDVGIRISIQDFQQGMNQVNASLRNMGSAVNSNVSGVNSALSSVATPARNMGTAVNASAQTSSNAIRSLLNTAVTSTPMINSQFGSIARMVTSLGGTIATLPGIIGMVILAIGALGTKMEVDVREWDNAFNVKIGNMRNTALNFATTMNTSVGANLNEVKKNLGRFYADLRGNGFGEQEAYKKAEELTKAAYDFSSLEHIPIADAMFAFQDALVGINLPMKQYGIVIHEAATENYAYTHSIAKVNTALSDHQKMAAAEGLLMQKIAYSAGDLAATQNSSANQLRKLGAQFTTFLTDIGRGLEPFFNAMLNELTAVMPVLIKLAEGFAWLGGEVYKVSAGIGGAIAGMINGAGAMDGYSNAYNTAAEYLANYNDETKRRAEEAEKSRDASNKETEALNKQTKAIKNNLQAFDELHVMQANIASSLPSTTAPNPDNGSTNKLQPVDNPTNKDKNNFAIVVPPIKIDPPPIAPVVEAFNKIMEKIREVSVLTPVVVGVQIRNALEPTLQGIRNILNAFQPASILVPILVKNALEPRLQEIKNVLNAFTPVSIVVPILVKNSLEPTLQGIRNILNAFQPASILVPILVKNALEPRLQEIKNVLNAFTPVSIVVPILVKNELEPNFQKIKDTLNLGLVAMSLAVSIFANKFVEDFKTMCEGAWNKLDWLGSESVAIFAQMQTAIETTSFSMASSFASNIYNGVKNALSYLSTLYQSLKQGAVQALGAIKEVTAYTADTVVNWVSGHQKEIIAGIAITGLTVGAILAAPETGGASLVAGAGAVSRLVPAFAVGTNYVPQDMLAMVHQGEAIIPAAYNPANGGTNNSGTNQQSGNIELVFNIDGTQFARATIPAFDKERSRIGRVIIKPI